MSASLEVADHDGHAVGIGSGRGAVPSSHPYGVPFAQSITTSIEKHLDRNVQQMALHIGLRSEVSDRFELVFFGANDFPQGQAIAEIVHVSADAEQPSRVIDR